MSAPTVIPDTITETPTTRLVTIVCPYCRRRHTHGWPYGTATIGHRSAHCHRPADRAINSDGYVIAPAAHENERPVA